MCPRLFDLETVAYWILEKEAHSQKFKANLRHITQDVFDLYVRRDKLYIKALKLSGRHDREAFKPHTYEISDKNVHITSPRKEPPADLGTRLKDFRLRAGMSQKDLADKVEVTPSFLSQLENNQISPSLNSFLQICRALGVNAAQFLDARETSGFRWLFRKESVSSRLVPMGDGVSGYEIVSDEKLSAAVVVMPAAVALKKHFHTSKDPEFVYVIRGAVSVTIEGSTEVLHSGDSVYLKDVVPVQWKGEGGGDTELLVVW